MQLTVWLTLELSSDSGQALLCREQMDDFKMLLWTAGPRESTDDRNEKKAHTLLLPFFFLSFFPLVSPDLVKG